MSAEATGPAGVATADASDAEGRISRTSGAFGQGGAPPPPPPWRERIVRAVKSVLDDPNPILLKELRATYRTPFFVRSLYLLTGLVGLLVLSFGASFAAGERPPADVGRMVFHLFFTSVVVVLSLAAPAYAATAITSERELRTYESLLLSGMTPWRIVVGKLLATYGSIILIVVAVSPVVGVAFLFGGISPFAVVTGFAWVLMLLAPAVGLGLAVSAQMSSTRIAAAVATFIYVPTAMMLSGFLVAMGELAHDRWSTPFEGPFWFAEAFPERVFEWDGWVYLVFLPIYVTAMPTWLFVASAVAGVRPVAEDRSSALKVWTVVAVIGAIICAPLVVSPMTRGNDMGEASIVCAIVASFLVYFIAVLFGDEPPLPPRETTPRTLLRTMLSPIGPGAAGTLRFTYLAIAGATVGVSLALALARHVLHPSASHHLDFDAALFALAIGNAAVGCFLAGLVAWLRQTLRNAMAARVLAMAAMAALVMLPFLVTLILEPRALDRLDRDIPTLVYLSPMLPTILGVAVGVEQDMHPEEALAVIITVVGYGLLALVAWIAVEAQVVLARRRTEERQARWAAPVSASAAATPPPSASRAIDEPSRPASPPAPATEAIAADAPSDATRDAEPPPDPPDEPTP